MSLIEKNIFHTSLQLFQLEPTCTPIIPISATDTKRLHKTTLINKYLHEWFLCGCEMILDVCSLTTSAALNNFANSSFSYISRGNTKT